MMDKLPTRKEIQERGKYVSTGYGICKEFEWGRYQYEGERYDVAMFDIKDNVVHIGRTYCDVCGRATYKHSCCGQSLVAIQQ